MGYVIELSKASIATFEAHRQKGRFHREIGGQLFARFLDGCLLVERATCVRGVRSRLSFWPNRTEEQAEIDALFADGLHYVGDWHTHPESQPSPSKPDRNKMFAIFRQSRHELPFMLMVIIGLDPFPDGLFIAAVSSADFRQLALA